MIQLAELPTRRNEAWKYSDLRAAMDGVALEPTKSAVLGSREDVIGALAAQVGEVEAVSVKKGAPVVRIERLGQAFAPRLVNAQVEPGATLVRSAARPV